MQLLAITVGVFGVALTGCNDGGQDIVIASPDGGPLDVCEIGYAQCIVPSGSDVGPGGEPVEYTTVCALLNSDPANCGACGRSCGAAPCVRGSCTCVPFTMSMLCTTNELTHCGPMSDGCAGTIQCGTCDAGQVCTDTNNGTFCVPK